MTVQKSALIGGLWFAAALVGCRAHGTVKVDAPSPDVKLEVGAPKTEICACKTGCKCNHCTGQSQGACPCSKGAKKGHGKKEK